MKIKASILILTSVIFGCNLSNQKSDFKTENEKKSSTIEVKKIEVEKVPDVVVKCDCKQQDYIRNYSTDLVFRNSGHYKAVNDSLFEKWSQDSLFKLVESIRFVRYDTIPEKFSKFIEVNRVSIENRNGIYGLDYFPKLKTVHFFGSKISLKTNEKWVGKIEALYAQKSKFRGLSSFKNVPNLRVLYFAFSGFDNFPTDINELRCLKEITLGSYVGELDLSRLDFTKNYCLRKIEMLTWGNNFIGIPITNSRIKRLKINHPNLTKEEKSVLKNHNKTK